MIRPVLMVLLLLGGCNDMVRQPRADDYEESRLFPNGMAMQAPPPGTVDRSLPRRIAAAKRPPMSLALLRRGRERYEIFCAPCHGLDGRGDGEVPARGFPAPPSYFEPRLRAAPAAHFYDVISNGYGVMYAYRDRVPEADRWAIAAYVRAIQATDGVPVAALTSSARDRLGATHAD